jgi:hypothetical protein
MDSCPRTHAAEKEYPACIFQHADSPYTVEFTNGNLQRDSHRQRSKPRLGDLQDLKMVLREFRSGHDEVDKAGSLAGID